jgi:hypothetical protein
MGLLALTLWYVIFKNHGLHPFVVPAVTLKQI